MTVQYQPNEQDGGILDDITKFVRESLINWYGSRSSLDSDQPEIHSYRNSFILRYPITTADAQKKSVLVKMRRNPKMQSFLQAVQADIHQNVPSEYQSLQFVYERLDHMDDDLDAIRPLSFIERYSAIVMEEYPSRTLRKLLNTQRTSKTSKSMYELKDAARKTGRWLYYFHHYLHSPIEKPYTNADILLEVQDYAERIESYSQGRVQAKPILKSFSEKLENILLEQIAFSQSHADMTCDNVLYSEDQKVCVIDIKTRIAPIYADLGLILIHPETTKPQIFSSGRYYRESVLRQYRAEIVAGYFGEHPGNEVLARVYSAVKVLDKWLMYEELMSRYKGIKHMLSIPAAPLVSAYFWHVMKKHLKLIGSGKEEESLKVDKTAVSTSS